MSGSRDERAQVLLVDDEVMVLDEYSEFLELEGIDCSVQADPQAALELVLANPQIRVVVTDLRMPALNGDELIRVLRSRLPASRQIRFVVLSGYGASALTDRLPDVPILEKPVDLDRLVCAIRDALA